LASYVTAAFYGLMVLVPGANSADVVAVNGTLAGVDPHTTRLAIDALAIRYEPGDAKPDDYFVSESGKRLAIWNITHTEVSFVRATGAIVREDTIGDFKDDVEEPPDPGNEDHWKDLHWLANVSRAAADRPDDEGRFVDPGYLQPHAHTSSACSNPTDALIRLTSGTLSVRKPTSDKLQADPVKFSDGAATDFKRSLSDYFSIKIDFTDAPTVVLKAFEGGARRIHIKSSANPTIVFSSLPLPASKHAHKGKDEVDHFEAYYSLLKDPLRKRKPDFSRGISSTECPPALARVR
jgi:hypothetical protein